MAKTVLETFALGRTPYMTFDPFLFCMHHRDVFPCGMANLGVSPELLRGREIGSDFSNKDGWSMYHGRSAPGFPSHPHRGFETITVVNAGVVDHSDSMGCTARFGHGDTQWLTAGKGIQHSEMFPLLETSRENTAELFQVWLNLPRKNKMCEPYFTMLWSELTRVAVYTNGQGIVSTVKVVAGELFDTKPLPPPPHSWASEPDSDVAVWWITIPTGGTLALPAAASPTTTRALYFVSGEMVRVNGATSLKVRTGARVDADMELCLEAIGDTARILLLQGRPIGEPVAQHGPFVMNTQEEIRQCFRDYQATEFGGWPWPRSDHMHSRDTPRHARRGSGSVETPPGSKPGAK